MSERSREERIAQGIGKVVAGQSQLQAAHEVNIPRRTLGYHYQRWLAGEDAATKRRLQEEVIAQQFQTVMLGMQEIQRRLQDPEIVAKIRDGDLNAYVGTAADKLAKYQRWGAPGEHEGGGAMDRLLQSLEERGGKLKLEVSHEPHEQAIDVTPERSTTEHE